jgi:signal transduction histidine kinase
MIDGITERKQAEAEIRKALEKERELRELKSSFVSMVSHEFRTPLATILVAAELLEHYSDQWTQEKKLTYFRRIQSTVKQLTQLLSDVLLIGKTEAGKIEFNPAPLNLVQFCCELVEELQFGVNSNQHAINFVSQCECLNACMDKKLLRHIFSNLLSNAIKYSPAGGTINFELSCQQGEAIFEVKDEGIGIPLEDQQGLFESFHRASNVGEIPGTGLGLAIVKTAVELHQGKIVVNSEVGVGTTFTVTLPLNRDRQDEVLGFNPS